VSKIIAFREWVFKGGVSYPDGETRTLYQSLEREVRDQIRLLLRNLDSLSGFDPSGTRVVESTTPQDTLRWGAMAREAEVVCGKVCVLLALYSERRAFGLGDERLRLSEALAKSDPKNDPIDHGELKSKEQALQRIDAALTDVTIESNRENFSTVLYFRILFSILSVATVFGVMSIGSEARNIGSMSLWISVFNFIVTALITYGLTLFIALGFQQEAMKNRTWENIFSGKRSKAFPQYAAMFVGLWVCCLVGLIGYNIYSAIASSSFEIVSERFEKVLYFAFKGEFHRAMMGALLAVCVLVIVDAWRDRRLEGVDSFWSVLLVCLTTLTMAGFGAYARRAELLVAGVSPEDLAGRGIFWTGLTYGTIGFVASFFSVLVIAEEFVSREKTNKNYGYVKQPSMSLKKFLARG
jgi:hypothetical protein